MIGMIFFSVLVIATFIFIKNMLNAKKAKELMAILERYSMDVIEILDDENMPADKDYKRILETETVILTLAITRHIILDKKSVKLNSSLNKATKKRTKHIKQLLNSDVTNNAIKFILLDRRLLYSNGFDSLIKLVSHEKMPILTESELLSSFYTRCSEYTKEYEGVFLSDAMLECENLMTLEHFNEKMIELFTTLLRFIERHN